MNQPVSSRPVPSRIVLVVEDEPFIRMNTLDVLADAGFEAVEAADAEEALALLVAHPSIGLLFTDINMPGEMDGLDLARCVHRRWPGIRLILTSGKIRPTPEELPASGTFIGKPYGEKQFVSLVETAFLR